MIFLRYESFRSYIRLYPVTTVILALNLIVFLSDRFLFDGQLTLRGLFYQIPVEDPYGLHEPWRYLTSIVLHGGWDHLLFNCFSTLVFAPPLERLIGHGRYLLFYVAAGISGNILSAIVHIGEFHASVGASGAIYGVFGAFLYMAMFQKHTLDEGSRKTVYSILAFGLIYSLLLPGIDIWAHVGGALGGFAMMRGMVMNAIRRGRR